MGQYNVIYLWNFHDWGELLFRFSDEVLQQKHLHNSRILLIPISLSLYLFSSELLIVLLQVMSSIVYTNWLYIATRLLKMGRWISIRVIFTPFRIHLFHASAASLRKWINNVWSSVVLHTPFSSIPSNSNRQGFAFQKKNMDESTFSRNSFE